MNIMNKIREGEASVNLRIRLVHVKKQKIFAFGNLS